MIFLYVKIVILAHANDGKYHRQQYSFLNHIEKIVEILLILC